MSTSFTAGAGFIELAERERLEVSGPQALWFLNQLVTNQVEDVPEGSGRLALLLTPKGRIIAVLRIWSTAPGALMDVEAARGESAPLFDFLQGRLFATKAAIRSVTSDFRAIRVAGPEALLVAERAFGVRLDAPGSMARLPAGLLMRLPAPLEGFDLWTRRDLGPEPFAQLKSAGVPQLLESEYDSYRVAVGWPSFGVDFDESFLPQEAAMERAVHFKKGCYLGQEAVAMTQRGRVRRRLRHLSFEGEPSLGPIYRGGDAVGSVTSIGSAASGSFGIGTVSTSVFPGEKVLVRGDDGRLAVVEELPGTVTGPVVPSARELRERLQSYGPDR